MEKLKPGVYSVFVLLEGGFWEQATYRISGNNWTEQKLEAAAMEEYASQNPIYACGVCPDNDAPENCITQVF